MRSLRGSSPEQTGLGTCLHGGSRGMALGWETLTPLQQEARSDTPPASHSSTEAGAHELPTEQQGVVLGFESSVRRHGWCLAKHHQDQDLEA